MLPMFSQIYTYLSYPSALIRCLFLVCHKKIMCCFINKSKLPKPNWLFIAHYHHMQLHPGNLAANKNTGHSLALKSALQLKFSWGSLEFGISGIKIVQIVVNCILKWFFTHVSESVLLHTYVKCSVQQCCNSHFLLSANSDTIN